MEIDGYRVVMRFDPDIDMYRGEFVDLNGGAGYARDIAGLKHEGAAARARRRIAWALPPGRAEPIVAIGSATSTGPTPTARSRRSARCCAAPRA